MNITLTNSESFQGHWSRLSIPRKTRRLNYREITHFYVPEAGEDKYAIEYALRDKVKTLGGEIGKIVRERGRRVMHHVFVSSEWHQARRAPVMPSPSSQPKELRFRRNGDLMVVG